MSKLHCSDTLLLYSNRLSFHSIDDFYASLRVINSFQTETDYLVSNEMAWIATIFHAQIPSILQLFMYLDVLFSVLSIQLAMLVLWRSKISTQHISLCIKHLFPILFSGFLKYIPIKLRKSISSNRF